MKEGKVKYTAVLSPDIVGLLGDRVVVLYMNTACFLSKLPSPVLVNLAHGLITGVDMLSEAQPRITSSGRWFLCSTSRPQL